MRCLSALTLNFTCSSRSGTVGRAAISQSSRATWIAIKIGLPGISDAAEHASNEQLEKLTQALKINSQSLDDNALFIRSDAAA
jgi:hypothetical protein